MGNINDRELLEGQVVEKVKKTRRSKDVNQTEGNIYVLRTDYSGYAEKITGHNNTVRDIVGRRFGHITVIEYLYTLRFETDGKSDYVLLYNCKCDCGNTCIASRKELMDKRVATGELVPVCEKCRGIEPMNTDNFVVGTEDNEHIKAVEEVLVRPVTVSDEEQCLAETEAVNQLDSAVNVQGQSDRENNGDGQCLTENDTVNQLDSAVNVQGKSDRENKGEHVKMNKIVDNVIIIENGVLDIDKTLVNCISLLIQDCELTFSDFSVSETSASCTSRVAIRNDKISIFCRRYKDIVINYDDDRELRNKMLIVLIEGYIKK